MVDEVKATTTAEALLGMLSMGPMSGYELKQRIEFSIGNFWSESFGQIYPTLKRLQAHGLVRAEEGERAGSSVYRLTSAGYERLEQWLGSPARPQVQRNELLLKLFFGNLAPVELSRERVLAAREQNSAALARFAKAEEWLKRARAGEPGLPFWLMTLSHGQHRVRALLAWCDETLAMLETLEKGKREHEEDRRHGGFPTGDRKVVEA